MAVAKMMLLINRGLSTIIEARSRSSCGIERERNGATASNIRHWDREEATGTLSQAHSDAILSILMNDTLSIILTTLTC